MAAETILHSGEFVTHDDELVMVTFYRRTDLNAVPSSMSFGISGGTETLEIWSRTGEAILTINPTYDWLNYQQVSAEPIVGTEYHKYTYNIICSANASYERTGYLDVGIEYGQGVGETVQVTVTQDGNPLPDALSVRDASMSFIAEGESKSTTVENIVGTLTHTEPNWITLAMSGTGSSRTVSVSATANSSSTARSGSVVFDDDRLNPVSMAVSQVGASAVLTVTPTSLSFVAAGEYKTVTATNISGVLTYSTSYSGGDTNWILYSTSGSGSTKTVTVIANPNTSSSSRSATAIFNDSNNNPVYVTITQDAGSGTGSISVRPSSVGLYYTAGQTEDIYVYGVSDFTYEVTYIDPNISGWLSFYKYDQYPPFLHISTSMNSSPDSRYAVIKITNSSDPTDYVEVPVRQFGQNN